MLNIWDAQDDLDHVGRALLLLERAPAGRDHDGPAALPIGERDRLLLDLRERLFGSQVEALEQCPACGAQLQIAFNIDAVRLQPQDGANGSVTIEADGFELTARPPTSRDLLDIRGCRDIGEARAGLLAKCLAEARRGDVPVEAGDLPDAVRDALSEALGEADPQAEIELQLDCADCGHGWRTHFDIVDYLWAEIEQAGRRMLRDVHLLARAYGWPESEILALSPRRRGYYLEMILDG